MKTGLLLNSNNKLCSYSEKYADLLKKNQLPFDFIDPNSYSLDKDLKECTHLLFRHSQGDTDQKIYEAVHYIASSVHGIKCYPDFETFWSYEDKAREYYLLRSNNLPIIDSCVFWNFEYAEAFLRNAKYPLVAKLPKGASSSNVVIVRSFNEGRRIARQVFTKGVRNNAMNSSSNLASLGKTGIIEYTRKLLRYFLINADVIKDKSYYPEWQVQKDSILFQKYLSGNEFDTRVTVIGDRAFAFRRFVRKNDFRASGSGNFDIDPLKVDRRCVEIAFNVSAKLNFHTMAYDFIYDSDRLPYINEISYCFIDSAVEACPGYWDKNMNWHEGRNWPQYYQLSDFLELDNLLPL